jgi:glutaminyl-tRNA synthetase
VIADAKLEPSLAEAAQMEKFQFERLGYFCVEKDSTKEKLVLNRTVPLRDTWAKVEKSEKKKP